MKALKIGEVAKETALSVKAIRFYEKIGLMPRPERTISSGYRLYTEGDVRRLRLIQRFKLLGLRLSQIKEIVASLKGEGCDCKRVKPHLQRLVNQELQEIEKNIQELTHLSGTGECGCGCEDLRELSPKRSLPIVQDSDECGDGSCGCGCADVSEKEDR